MTAELGRLAAGLPVAMLWPLAVPSLREHRRRTIVASLVSGLYVAAPSLPGWQGFVLPAATAAAAGFVWSKPQRGDLTPRASLRSLSPWLSALFIALLAGVVVSTGSTLDALRGAVESDSVSLAASGLFAAVFVGALVVGQLLAPFTDALGEHGEDLPSLRNAGLYIGWFERALFFAFIVGGEPQGAAIALAAKSFARFPALREHHEGFAEYFLIGSLASLVVALGFAVATRAALGLPLI
jgi:hypothetical protein